MSDIVIKAENIGKLYKLGEIGTGTLSHDLNRWWANFRGKEDPFSKIGQINERTQRADSDYVWALKDINFEVRGGEVLGIIGRNGAGKSTLLKILSKVTAPSTGQIKLRGRIASLLEVGTGFHPELTGRENIFLNGAILGMTKVEIRKKFDEIVDFAGVDRYIDTPVKRYSSGMYVRLAFAVAAFLEPEILIVDEVLAVGDAEFQEKCLGRMQDVSKNDGRTVLFVSHDLNAVENLCSRVLCLHNGTVTGDGGADSTIKFYLNNIRAFNSVINKALVHKVYLSEFKLSQYEIYTGEEIKFYISIAFESRPKIEDLCLLIYNSRNIRVAIIDLRCYFNSLVFTGSFVTYQGIIKDLNLVEGDYFLGLHYNINNVRKDLYNLINFRIKSSLYSGSVRKYQSQHRGVMELIHFPSNSGRL